MATMRVVEAVDVVPDVFRRLVSAPVFPSVNPLLLQGAEEALHRRVVVAVSLTTHAGERTCSYQPALIVVCGVLSSAIRMVNEATTRLPDSQGFLQSSESEKAINPVTCIPA